MKNATYILSSILIFFNMNIYVYEYEIDPKPFVDNSLYIVID